jgi:hypothetical protein
LVVFLSVLGIIISIAGGGFLKRMAIDFKFRFYQLSRLEEFLKIGPVRPSKDANIFFFGKEEHYDAEENKKIKDLSLKYSYKGLKATHAYLISVVAICVFYLVIALYSIILFYRLSFMDVVSSILIGIFSTLN